MKEKVLRIAAGFLMAAGAFIMVMGFGTAATAVNMPSGSQPLTVPTYCVAKEYHQCPSTSAHPSTSPSKSASSSPSTSSHPSSSASSTPSMSASHSASASASASATATVVPVPVGNTTLPVTGSNVPKIVGVGALVLLLGLGCVVVARRLRRRVRFQA